jgi:hypothetical protein
MAGKGMSATTGHTGSMLVADPHAAVCELCGHFVRAVFTGGGERRQVGSLRILMCIGRNNWACARVGA